MKFDYNGSVALFEQVAEQLEQEIFVGLYREGDQVPSTCLLYTSPSPRDRTRSSMPSSA